MRGYATRDVAHILGLSAQQVLGYVRSGFLRPERGPRGDYRFSFEDLVFLRTAKGLLEARIGPRRVKRALAKLREQIPEGRRLTGLRITAEGSRIVVADGNARWQPESGQALLDFGVSELAEKFAPLAREAFREAQEGGDELTADGWYEWGCELETAAPPEAREAYSRAVALDPGHADALVNLGRLLHESGDPRGAEEHYRRAIAARPGDATAVFNLGVALEDLERRDEALAAYERAVELDPDSADAHYNAASLYERLGQVPAALNHLKSYRNILRSGR
ncbi:MAG: tetratricopeptide repeat protein [Thermoanaerobaculia bacterium]